MAFIISCNFYFTCYIIYEWNSNVTIDFFKETKCK